MTSQQLELVQNPHNEELQEYFSKNTLKFTSYFVEKASKCKTTAEFLNASIDTPDIYIPKTTIRKLIHEFKSRNKSFLFSDQKTSIVDLEGHDYIIIYDQGQFYGYISKDKRNLSEKPMGIKIIMKEIFPDCDFSSHKKLKTQFQIKNAFYVKWFFLTEKNLPLAINSQLSELIHDIYFNCIKIDRPISKYLEAIDTINNKNPLQYNKKDEFLGSLINWYKNQSSLPFPLYYKVVNQPDLVLEGKFTKAVAISNEKTQYKYNGIKVEKPNVTAFTHKKVIEIKVQKPTVTQLNWQKAIEIENTPPKEEQNPPNQETKDNKDQIPNSEPDQPNDLSLVYVISEGNSLMIGQDGYPYFCPTYVSRNQPIKIKALDAKFKPIIHRIQFYCNPPPNYAFNSETKETFIYIDEFHTNIPITIYFTEEFYTNLIFNFQVVPGSAPPPKTENYSILKLNQSEIWTCDISETVH